ncbi:hypothetical protein AB0K18_45255 [Nonomuraea sp. NPDC049421]
MSAVTDWVKHDHAEVIAETPELARAHIVQMLTPEEFAKLVTDVL